MCHALGSTPSGSVKGVHFFEEQTCHCAQVTNDEIDKCAEALAAALNKVAK